MEYVVLALGSVIFGYCLGFILKDFAKPLNAFIFLSLASILILVPSISVICTGNPVGKEIECFNFIRLNMVITPISALYAGLASILSVFISLKSVLDRTSFSQISFIFTYFSIFCLIFNDIKLILLSITVLLILLISLHLKKNALRHLYGIFFTGMLLYGLSWFLHNKGLIHPAIIYSIFVSAVIFVIRSAYCLLTATEKNNITRLLRMVSYSVIFLETSAVLLGFLYEIPALLVFAAFGLGVNLVSFMITELYLVYRKFGEESVLRNALFYAAGFFFPLAAPFIGIIYAMSGYFIIFPFKPFLSFFLMSLTFIAVAASLYFSLKYFVRKYKNFKPKFEIKKFSNVESLVEVVCLFILLLSGLCPAKFLRLLYVPISVFILGDAKYELLNTALKEVFGIQIFLAVFALLLVFGAALLSLKKRQKLKSE